jgi:hypothetical protein
MRPKDIRRNNLRILVNETGSAAEVARRCGASEKYLRQLLGEVEQRGTVRGMGDRTAKKIEEAFNKPDGWMDADHSSSYLPPEDGRFLKEVEMDIGKYAVPEHIKQTIITLITSSPKRTSD